MFWPTELSTLSLKLPPVSDDTDRWSPWNGLILWFCQVVFETVSVSGAPAKLVAVLLLTRNWTVFDRSNVVPVIDDVPSRLVMLKPWKLAVSLSVPPPLYEPPWMTRLVTLLPRKPWPTESVALTSFRVRPTTLVASIQLELSLPALLAPLWAIVMPDSDTARVLFRKIESPVVFWIVPPDPALPVPATVRPP